ncbi:MAG TPA: tetratricopeptide repeat protein [Vicinamibacterales bacterium]|nr:tetratricopeptide repeat protein [Vicinamibacterales bacterium]
MGALHPQVVHFTIVLAIVGVAFRLMSLLGKPAFASPAATTLLLLAAASSVVSVRSGTAAHGPVERAPGARPAVMEHEEWGERTQTALLIVGGLEIVGLVLRGSPQVRLVHLLASLAGLAAVVCVYEAGEHGGELVYGYAGGVGIRSGDPKDVERLLLAGYYHQALAERNSGHFDQAAELLSAAAARFPADPEVQMLAADSLLRDRKNSQGALDALAKVTLPPGNRFMAFQHATLQADAYEALGRKDAAASALESVLKTFPNPRLQQRANTLRKQSN